MRGDLGTFGATVASPGSSSVTQDFGVTSTNHTLVLATLIVSTLDSFGHVLMGGKVAWCSMLCTGSNLKKTSVASRLPQGVS